MKYTYWAKLFITVTLAALCIFGLSSCEKAEKPNTIKVGTISGPETQLMQAAKTVAKDRYGLNVEIVPFTDYTMPNRALNDGDIDANSFQTIPYLNADIKAHGYKLAIVGKTFIYPMAIYSKKIKSIDATPENASVAIPNDPSNEARALLLLQKAGLIKLKSGVGTLATVLDISNNPKNLKIKPLDAAQLPRVLDDVTLAVINTNYAVPAGLYPNKNGIFLEDKTSPYANIVVVRAKDKNSKKVKELVAALHSPMVLETAKKLFKNQVVPAWN